MAVKARDDVTLATVTDVANVRRYYLLQSSTLAAPAAPSVNPAPSPWVTTEPTYSEGSTNTLYTVDLTVFSDGSFDYSPVSKSSSYEAAKSAFNKAVSATSTANAALAAVPPFVQQATPSATVVGQLWYPIDSSGRIIGMKRASTTGTGGWQTYLMMAGQILVPGTVGTTEIGPEGVLAANIKASNELWAKIAVFAKVTTQMLIAGDAKITGSLLADVIQLATRLVAGNPDGTRVELDGTGLTVYRTSVDGDVLPAIRLGLAGESDFFGILDTSGDTLSSLDEDGNITGRTVNANEGITLAGQDLAETLASMPQGMISKTKLLGGTYTLSVAPQALVSTDITLPGTGDRQLRIMVGILHDSSSVQNIEANLRCSTTGTASTGNSAQIKFNFDTQANRAQSLFVWELNTSELNVDPDGDRFLSILLEAHNPSSGVSGNTILGGDYGGGETFISVEDIGAAVPTGRQAQQSANPSTGGASQGKVTRTKTYSATACQSYLGSGAKYAYNVGKAYQGSYGSNTGLHSLWIFPSVISDLSGATVDKVILRITNNHTVANAGGTARIQTHGQTGVPTTYAGGSAVANVGFAKGQTKDINLTSQAAAGLKSGAIRGFGLLASAASDYGYWAGDAKLIITYTK